MFLFFDTMIILCTYYTKSCLFITIHFLVYYCSILSRFFLLKYETTHNKKTKTTKKMPCIIASNLFYFISFAKDLLLSSTNLNQKVEIRYQQWTSNQLPNLASHFWSSEFDFIALSRFFPLHARVVFQYQSSKFWIFSFAQNAKLLTFHRILPKTQIKCSIWHFIPKSFFFIGPTIFPCQVQVKGARLQGSFCSKNVKP